MSGDVIDFLHANSPDAFCVSCLVNAYPDFGSAIDMRAFLGVLMRRGEQLSVTEGLCLICSEKTMVVRSERLFGKAAG
jgi:hypothetical protein